MPAGFTKTKRRRYTGQQPGTKSARSPANQLLTNRGSTAGQPLISFLHWFKWGVFCSCFQRDVQDIVLDSLEGERECCLLAGSTGRHPVLPSPALPRCPAVRCPYTTGPECVRFLDSKISW